MKRDPRILAALPCPDPIVTVFLDNHFSFCSFVRSRGNFKRRLKRNRASTKGLLLETVDPRRPPDVGLAGEGDDGAGPDPPTPFGASLPDGGVSSAGTSLTGSVVGKGVAAASSGGVGSVVGTDVATMMGVRLLVGTGVVGAAAASGVGSLVGEGVTTSMGVGPLVGEGVEGRSVGSLVGDGVATLTGGGALVGEGNVGEMGKSPPLPPPPPSSASLAVHETVNPR